jgi:hypothetical protein
VRQCAGVLQTAGPLDIRDARPEFTVLEVEIWGIYPLRVLKEVIANMLALNGEGNPNFRTRHPDLVEFVLDRERKGLPDRYHIYAVLYGGPMARFVPLSMFAKASHRWWLTSVDHPPVAHVLSMDEQVPFLEMGEITNFADSGYDQEARWRGDLLLGFGHLPFPGDYRSAARIKVDAATNTVIHTDDPGKDHGI